MKYIFLCPIVLIVAACFIYFEKKKNYNLAVILKGLASALFVILGVLSAKRTGDFEFSKLVLIGLLLGFLGDILLNLRFCYPKIGMPIFLVGILVFMSGHIMYLVALISKSRNLLVSILAGVVLAALLLIWIFSKITAKKAFKIFGIFYIGAISIMTAVSIGVLISVPCTWTIMFTIGAILFLASDVVLILNTFGSETKFSLRVTNLGLYYLGQIMIALCLQQVV